MNQADKAIQKCGICYADEEEDGMCAANQPGTNYSCTKPKGHEGNHVACGIFQHKLSEWEPAK